MLNYIWLGLVVLAVLMGGFTGQLLEVSGAAFEACKTAVMVIALPLAGIMALWLGLMKLAEKSGLVAILALALRPVLKWLFPEVPAAHPAMGAIVMNTAANMLGLSNAATPLGLRAMQALETLNPRPGTATNAMCTFLAINTSSVQLIPATTIAILAAAGSLAPTQIIGTAFFATCCSTIAGIAAVKFFEHLPMYALPAGDLPGQVAWDGKGEAEAEAALRPSAWGTVLLVAFFACFVWFAVQFSWSPAQVGRGGLLAAVDAVSYLAIPFLIGFFPLYAALCRVPVYEEFVEGAKEGFQVAIRIIPYLVAIMAAVAMFRAAGGIALLTKALQPALAALSFPPDLLPLVLMRPLSGSGANGLFAELVQTHGPDSLIARMGASIMGSTETTFYVIAVYFGSVAVKRTRHAVPAGLCADLAGVVASVTICNLMFGR
jgi:spore maturation protein SpmA